MDGWTGGNFPTVPFTLNRQSPQAKGLIGWWPTVGQSTSRVLYDYSGYGRNMYPNNVPTLKPAPAMGKAVSFVAASTQSYYADYNIDFVVKPLTLSVWVYDDGVNSNNGYAFTVCAGTAFTRYAGIRFSGIDAWAAAAHRNSIEQYATSSGGKAVAGQWFHLVARIVSQTLCELFFNGKLEAQNTGDSGSDIPYYDRVSLGCLGRATPVDYVDLLIADPRVYQGALSDATIWQMYDPATRFDLYAPLQRYWLVSAPAAPAATISPLSMYYFRQRRAG